MPQAIPLLIVLALPAGASLATIAFVQLAASVVVAGITAALTDDPFESSGGITVNKKTPSPERSLLFGRIRTGGTTTYITTSENAGEILHLVLSICEGSCHRLLAVQMDDIYLYPDMVDSQGFAKTGRYSTFYNSKHWPMVNYQYDLGTVGTPFPPALANPGGLEVWDTDAHWQLSRIPDEWDSATMRQDGVTKIYWRGKIWGGIWPTGAPNVSSWWDGQQVYDPRYSVNVYTRNVVLIARHYMLMTEEAGGFGANTGTLPDADWITQANLCEEMVLSPTGLQWTSGNVNIAPTVHPTLNYAYQPTATSPANMECTWSGDGSSAGDVADRLVEGGIYRFNNVVGMVGLEDVYFIATSVTHGTRSASAEYRHYTQFTPTDLDGVPLDISVYAALTDNTTDYGNNLNEIHEYSVPANLASDILYIEGGGQNEALLELEWGTQIKVISTDGTLPSGLVLNDLYYVDPVQFSKGWEGSLDRRWGIKLSTSFENLSKGTYIDITDFGSGTLTIEKYAEPRYMMSAYIPLNQRPKQILNKMMDACFGILRESGGEYTIRVGAYYSSDLTITESMVTDYPDITTGVSARDNFNSVSGEFLSVLWHGQKTTYPEYKNLTYIDTRDNGIVVTKNMSFPYVSSPSQCQRLAKILVETEAQEIRVKVPMKIIGLKLQPGSTFKFDDSFLGWSEKEFRCTKVEVQPQASPNGETGMFPVVVIYGQETASSIYDWNSGEEISIDPAPNTDHPLPIIVADPTNLTVTDTVITSDPTSIDKPIATLSWSVETNFLNYSFDVRYRIDDGLEVEDSDSSWTYMSQTTDMSIPIYDLYYPEDYRFEVRARNILQHVSGWAIVTHRVVAPLGFPADVTGFTATIQGSLALFKWNASIENWVKNGGSFEIRHTSETGTTDYYSTVSMQGGTVSGISTQVLLPVIDGTFMIKAVNIYGTRSANPATVEVSESDMLDSFTLTHTLDESTGGFTGTKVDCSVVTSNLELDVNGGDVEALGTYAGATHYDAAAVTNFRIIKRLESLTFPESGDLWDSRTDLIDTWPDIDGVAGGAETDVIYYVRHAQEVYASAVWSDWIPFDVMEISARSFEVKAELISESVDTNIQVILMKAQFYEKV